MKFSERTIAIVLVFGLGTLEPVLRLIISGSDFRFGPLARFYLGWHYCGGIILVGIIAKVPSLWHFCELG